MYDFENLERYRVFLAVAESGSISAAASGLYISQPAVSTAIKKLEESLGLSLFVRTPKGVKLTEKGAILYNGVRKAFSALSDTERSVSGGTGTLRIAASNVLCRYYLLPYLKTFTEQYPFEEVKVICMSSAEASKMLYDGEVDIALVAKPDSLKHCKYVSLGTVEDIFVCSPSYYGRITDRWMKNSNLLLLNKGNVSRTHIDKTFESNGMKPEHILEVNNMDMLIEFAKTGIGVSCVIKQFVERELADGTLIEVKSGMKFKAREIGFLYRDTYPENINIKKFLRS